MKNKNGNLLTTQEVAQFLNISARSKPLEIEQNQNRETSLLRGKPY